MQQAHTRPARWKTWLLTVVGIYPLLCLMVTVIGHAAPSWPTWLRLAVIVPTAVACMVWAISPIEQRVLKRWLTT